MTDFDFDHQNFANKSLVPYVQKSEDNVDIFIVTYFKLNLIWLIFRKVIHESFSNLSTYVVIPG